MRQTLLSVPLVLLGVTASATTDERKPNVVFIMADDLGWGDLSCYGQKKFRTPNLDRMAAEGMRFTQYYAGSTVCAPSRAVLMTGYHTGHARIRGNADVPLEPEDVTVAETLKSAGYATGIAGKWGLGNPGSVGIPNKQGFDFWYGYLDQTHAHRFYTDHLWKNEEKVDPGTAYTHDLITDEAFSFVRANRKRPFFLYLAWTIPHAEMWVPEDSMAEYRGKFPETPFVNKTADAHPSKGYRSQATPHAATAAMISRMDRDMGRLFALLKELGIDENTVVFFTSDNGPHKEGGRDPKFFDSSGGLRGIKRDLYEGGIRVPMIARWPGKIPAGAVSDHVWGHWDFLPTAADLAGVKAPDGLDGTSMKAALLGRPCKTQDFLYWEFHEGAASKQAVRHGDWKAVRLGPGQPLELYDLKTDAAETKNLAEAHPAVVQRIEDYLRSARTENPRWTLKGK
ncbi:MAG TPA: arylsulfatase [Planctomycetota bacterium]|nr:arylsulfatase [Planctomycetota bacterium]